MRHTLHDGMLRDDIEPRSRPQPSMPAVGLMKDHENLPEVIAVSAAQSLQGCNRDANTCGLRQQRCKPQPSQRRNQSVFHTRPHLRVPVEADGVQPPDGLRRQQVPPPKLALQLHPQRKLPRRGTAAGAPVGAQPAELVARGERRACLHVANALQRDGMMSRLQRAAASSCKSAIRFSWFGTIEVCAHR